MKKILISLAAVLALLLAACSRPQPRTIETPEVTATNCSNLSLNRLELNDSATVISFHVSYRPGWWIRLAESTHLAAAGKEYPVTATDGITLGEQLTMPDSGETDFTLTFAPLPLDTKSFDFTEGTDDGWVFYGIDATGKGLDTDAWLAEIPDEALHTDTCVPFTAPVLKAAPSMLRFHMTAYRPEYGNKLRLTFLHLAGNNGTTLTLDENGEASLPITLYGTTLLNAFPEDLTGGTINVLLAPGDTTDIYITPGIFADYKAPTDAENTPPHTPYVYSTGRYAALDRALSRINGLAITPELDWHMTPQQYIAAYLDAREKKVNAIAASEQPDAVKEYAIRTANLTTISGVRNAWNNLANLYYDQNGREGLLDSIKIEITPEQYAAVAPLVDGDDSEYLTQPALGGILQQFDWKDYGAAGAFFTEAPQYIDAFSKAESATLDDAQAAALDTLSLPFYAQAARMRQQEAQKAFEDAAKALEEAQRLLAEGAQIPDELLFDAIVAPHKGKVVLVDLWNTWCAPCRSSIKLNEPLKTGEFAGKDIVWIYIADESSDPEQYAQMIKDIKGEHHKVNAKQIEIINNRFGVDGIPYYILVDRNGKAVGRPDLRNHSELIKVLHEAL